jgi:hypothetical protein
MVTQQEHDEATRRGEELVRTEPGAVSVRFNPATRRVTIDLNRGYSLSFSPERAQVLANASAEELAECEITSAGLGIYFPKLDHDMWVPAIVKGRFGNDRWEAAWAEAHAVQACVAQAEQSESAAA